MAKKKFTEANVADLSYDELRAMGHSDEEAQKMASPFEKPGQTPDEQLDLITEGVEGADEGGEAIPPEPVKKEPPKQEPVKPKEEPKKEPPKPEGEGKPEGEPVKETPPEPEPKKDVLADILLKNEQVEKEKKRIEEDIKRRDEALAAMSDEDREKYFEGVAQEKGKIATLESKLARMEEMQTYNRLRTELGEEEWALIEDTVTKLVESSKYDKLVEAGYTPEERAAEMVASARGIKLDAILKLRADKTAAQKEAEEVIEEARDFSQPKGKADASTAKSELEALREKALTVGLSHAETERMELLDSPELEGLKNIPK